MVSRPKYPLGLRISRAADADPSKRRVGKMSGEVRRISTSTSQGGDGHGEDLGARREREKGRWRETQPRRTSEVSSAWKLFQ